MPISVSVEAEAKAMQIPDFSARLERFIDEQFALEQWRKRRGNAEAVAIVEEGLRQSAALSAAGADRNTLFARLRALTDRLSNGR